MLLRIELFLFSATWQTDNHQTPKNLLWSICVTQYLGNGKLLAPCITCQALEVQSPVGNELTAARCSVTFCLLFSIPFLYIVLLTDFVGRYIFHILFHSDQSTLPAATPNCKYRFESSKSIYREGSHYRHSLNAEPSLSPEQLLSFETSASGVVPAYLRRQGTCVGLPLAFGTEQGRRES